MTETKNTPETAHTHANNENRCWQFCKCAECGIVHVCTPSFDFFSLGKEEPDETGFKLLYCNSCFMRRSKISRMEVSIDNSSEEDAKDAKNN